VAEVMIEPLERVLVRGLTLTLGHDVAAHVVARPAEAIEQNVERLVGQAGGVEAGAADAGDPLLRTHAHQAVALRQRHASMSNDPAQSRGDHEVPLVKSCYLRFTDNSPGLGTSATQRCSARSMRA
jgi:hypothetical protein